MRMFIHVKRAYDKPTANDGCRVLVDRLWPRGLSRQEARIDEWLRDVAPSKRLRQWFGHDPERWSEFRRRYFRELDQHTEAVRRLAARAQRRRVTLIYSAKDEQHNNAAALAAYLRQRKPAAKSPASPRRQS